MTADDRNDDRNDDEGDNGIDDGDNDGTDDGDDDDVDDCDTRKDVGKEDATNTAITSEQDDTLELHVSLSDTADDTVHEYSTSLCHMILLRQS